MNNGTIESVKSNNECLVETDMVQEQGVREGESVVIGIRNVFHTLFDVMLKSGTTMHCCLPSLFVSSVGMLCYIYGM